MSRRASAIALGAAMLLAQGWLLWAVTIDMTQFRLGAGATFIGIAIGVVLSKVIDAR